MDSVRGLRHIFVSIAAFLVVGPGSVSSLLEEEKQATFLSASVGEYVVFNCPLDFPHDIVIPYILRWNKDGNTVFSWNENVLTATESYVGRISLVPSDSPYGRGSVNLTSIRESDSGWYECSVFFPNRTPSTRPNGTWFHLTVDGGTLLAIPPINQTTIEGDKAVFPCVTKDSDAQATWYKDGVPLDEILDLKERSWVSPEGTLTIERTDVNDPGEYLCVVTNSLGDRQTASAYLNVQYKAKVVYAPEEVYLPYGRPGVLDCHFMSNPPLTNLRWEKDGFLFDPYNVAGVFYSRNGSLLFEKVEESHSGLYTCTPVNDLGTEGPSSPIKVIVQRPPVFTIVPHNMYLRKPGETLEMPCDAVDGNDRHRPTIVWFRVFIPIFCVSLGGCRTVVTITTTPQKDGSPLPKDRITIHNGNLTIENIKDSDRGQYQCVASNEAATISSDTELMIENASSRPPYNLTAISTENSVTLHWVPGYNRPKTEYSVWYRAADTPEWRTTKIVNRGVNEKTVSNLIPGRMYEFMVQSLDRNGEGMFSRAIRIRTKGFGTHNSSTSQTTQLGQFQQIGPPRNVSVHLTPDGYLVTWEPPEFGSEDLRFYTVRWTQSSREYIYGATETRETSFLAPSLEEDKTYYFEVIAVSNNDYQAASAKYVVHVPGYRQIRAVSVGIAVGVAFLLVAAGGSWYVRRLYVKRLAQEEKDDAY